MVFDVQAHVERSADVAVGERTGGPCCGQRQIQLTRCAEHQIAARGLLQRRDHRGGNLVGAVQLSGRQCLCEAGRVGNETQPYRLNLGFAGAVPIRRVRGQGDRLAGLPGPHPVRSGAHHALGSVAKTGSGLLRERLLLDRTGEGRQLDRQKRVGRGKLDRDALRRGRGDRRDAGERAADNAGRCRGVLQAPDHVGGGQRCTVPEGDAGLEVVDQCQRVGLAGGGEIGADRVIRFHPDQRFAEVHRDQGAAVVGGVGRVDGGRLAVRQSPGDGVDVAVRGAEGADCRGQGGRRRGAGGGGTAGGESEHGSETGGHQPAGPET